MSRVLSSLLLACIGVETQVHQAHQGPENTLHAQEMPAEKDAPAFGTDANGLAADGTVGEHFGTLPFHAWCRGPLAY